VVAVVVVCKYVINLEFGFWLFLADNFSVCFFLFFFTFFVAFRALIYYNFIWEIAYFKCILNVQKANHYLNN